MPCYGVGVDSTAAAVIVGILHSLELWDVEHLELASVLVCGLEVVAQFLLARGVDS